VTERARSPSLPFTKKGQPDRRTGLEVSIRHFSEIFAAVCPSVCHPSEAFPPWVAARAFRSAAAHELVHSAESDEARAHAALPAVASVAASSREHGPGVPDAAFPAAEARVANSEEVACPDVNCSDAQSAPAGV